MDPSRQPRPRGRARHRLRGDPRRGGRRWRRRSFRRDPGLRHRPARRPGLGGGHRPPPGADHRQGGGARRHHVPPSVPRKRVRVRGADPPRLLRHHGGGHRHRPHRTRTRSRRLGARRRPRHRGARDRRRGRPFPRPGAAFRRQARLRRERRDRRCPRRGRCLAGSRLPRPPLPPQLAVKSATHLPQHGPVVHLHGRDRAPRDGARGHRRDPVRARLGPEAPSAA